MLQRLIEEKAANLLKHATSLAIPSHSCHARRRRATFPAKKKTEEKPNKIRTHDQNSNKIKEREEVKFKKEMSLKAGSGREPPKLRGELSNN